MSDALALIARARTDAANIAAYLLGPSNRSLSSRKESKWGRQGSFSMTLIGAHAGKWRDHETEEHGDVLDLVQRERHCERAEALRWLAQDYYGDAPLKPIDRAKRRAEIERAEKADAQARQIKAQKARQFWSEAVPLKGTLAERYLARRLGGRNIPADVLAADCLRFHPSPLLQGESFGNLAGAMVARMVDPKTGAGVGLHRTFLTAEAQKIDRRMLGAAGVVCLTPYEDVSTGLGLGEGLESSLGVLAVFEWRPIWATLSAGTMRTFPVLEGVESLTVFADADESGTGQDSAGAVCQRWANAGREARSFLPPELGSDFGDMAKGRAA